MAPNGTHRGEEAASYALGAVVRLTGLSSHVIRAWERRYGAVRPQRTPGGTRRYTERDVARLRLLAAALAEGHRIGALAHLPDEAIERLIAPPRETSPGRAPLEGLVDAAVRLDLAELERRLGLQLAAVGPAGFARDVVAPLLRELGQRWEHGSISVASEHIASAVARTLLGGVLRLGPRGAGAPRLVFATPETERHELGALMAAVVAAAAGAEVTFLGPDLPVLDLVAAVRQIRPEAVVLGTVALTPGALRRYLTDLRGRLPAGVELWVGGGDAPCDLPGIDPITDLAALERRVSSLRRRPRSEQG